MAFKSNFKKILVLVLGIASFGTNSKNNVQAKSQSWIANNPVKSALIGALGLAGIIGAEEIIRRNFFNEKFGYDAEKDCVYKRKSGKVDIVIIGSSAEDRKQFIDDIKANKATLTDKNSNKNNNENGLADYIERKISRDGHHFGLKDLLIDEKRAKLLNFNIIEKDLNKDDPDEIANLLKNDVTMAIFMIKDNKENTKISEIYEKSLVSEFYNSTGNVSNHMNYKDREEVYRKGLCDIIEGNKGPAYFPVALSCGNMDNDDVKPEIRLLTYDHGMVYDTSTKEYIVGNYGSSYNIKKFSYSEEQFKEYGEKIKQKREKKKQRIKECKEKIKELMSQNKNVDEITKIIQESYKELGLKRSGIKEFVDAQNKA